MTKTIKICDVCKEEVNWLYNVPSINIEGYTLTVGEGNKIELCEKCTREWIKYTERDYFKERGVD